MGDKRKLPRIPMHERPHILRHIADKLELSVATECAYVQVDVSPLEVRIIVEVLRAAADGNRGLKALYGSGPLPPDQHAIVEKVSAEIRKRAQDRGSKTRALEAVSKRDGRSLTATLQARARAKRAAREPWRSAYLAGDWPGFCFWRLTDKEIEEFLLEDSVLRSMSVAPGDPEPQDVRAYLKARRDAEMDLFRELTGWSTPPPRDCDKSPPE